MEEILLNQQEATNQWAYYQAKVVREHLNRGNKMLIETQLQEPTSVRADERAKYQQLAVKFADEEKRMAGTRRTSRRTRANSRRVGTSAKDQDIYFDYAEVFLQIAIVSASVSILAASRPMLWFSLGLASLGALGAINGFLLLVRISFLH